LQEDSDFVQKKKRHAQGYASNWVELGGELKTPDCAGSCGSIKQYKGGGRWYMWVIPSLPYRRDLYNEDAFYMSSP